MIELLLGAGALFAAGLGIGAKENAKETNEKAQKRINEAKNLYNNAKKSMDSAKERAENQLLMLGQLKGEVLETSITEFISVYEKIKNVEVDNLQCFDEKQYFSFNEQDALHLCELSDILRPSLASEAVGAATGAAIAIAASGYLPVVAGTISVAGTAMMAGEIGTAASLAGSALSLGAAVTPLAAIVAPAMLFSGIRADRKADENLDKAETTYSEAKAAAEKMKTSEMICDAIATKAYVYAELLSKLSKLLSDCTKQMKKVIRRKSSILIKGRPLNIKKLSEKDLELIAATRSLAGAVKAVIDVPILSSKGDVSPESEKLYVEIVDNKLPTIEEHISTIR